MKYLISILLTLTIVLDSSADAKRRIIRLNGKISEKYPIKMILTIENKHVLGFYYYEKYKTKILLSGIIEGNRLTLMESPDYESEFKKGFIGDLTNNEFVGTWTDKISNKTLGFRISKDSDLITEISSEIEKLEGQYSNIFSSDKFMSSVSLQHISEDMFCFEISNGTDSGCVGYVKGLVQLTNFAQGIYTGDSCEEIAFSISSGTLILKERNCELHGMRCPFNGKYIKK